MQRKDPAICSVARLVYSLQMISMLPTRTLKLLEFVGFSGNKVSWLMTGLSV